MFVSTVATRSCFRSFRAACVMGLASLCQGDWRGESLVFPAPPVRGGSQEKAVGWVNPSRVAGGGVWSRSMHPAPSSSQKTQGPGEGRGKTARPCLLAALSLPPAVPGSRRLTRAPRRRRGGLRAPGRVPVVTPARVCPIHPPRRPWTKPNLPTVFDGQVGLSDPQDGLSLKLTSSSRSVQFSCSVVSDFVTPWTAARIGIAFLASDEVARMCFLHRE